MTTRSKYLLLLLALVLIASIVIYILSAITFTDPNFEATMRKAIEKPDGVLFDWDLKKLSYFAACGKGIADITGLEHCANLKGIILWNNRVSDISPLAALTRLEKLYIGKNRIADISPLVENGGLAAGDEVHLEGNPLDGRSISDFIPQLQERGVEVTW